MTLSAFGLSDVGFSEWVLSQLFDIHCFPFLFFVWFFSNNCYIYAFSSIFLPLTPITGPVIGISYRSIFTIFLYYISYLHIFNLHFVETRFSRKMACTELVQYFYFFIQINVFIFSPKATVRVPAFGIFIQSIIFPLIIIIYIFFFHWVAFFPLIFEYLSGSSLSSSFFPTFYLLSCDYCWTLQLAFFFIFLYLFSLVLQGFNSLYFSMCFPKRWKRKIMNIWF